MLKKKILCVKTKNCSHNEVGESGSYQDVNLKNDYKVVIDK